MNSDQHQRSQNAPAPLTVSSKEYIDILNIVTELCRDTINERHDFSIQEKKDMEQLIKEQNKTFAALLGPNLQLPDGEPLPIETLLCEPEDLALTKEKKEWDMKTRDALQQNIQERKQFGKGIEPLIQKAIDSEGTELTQGTFDDSSDHEPDDLLSLDPKYAPDIKKEFKDSLELLKNMEKEAPLRLAQYTEIGRILDTDKSTSP